MKTASLLAAAAIAAVYAAGFVLVAVRGPARFDSSRESTSAVRLDPETLLRGGDEHAKGGAATLSSPLPPRGENVKTSASASQALIVTPSPLVPGRALSSAVPPASSAAPASSAVPPAPVFVPLFPAPEVNNREVRVYVAPDDAPYADVFAAFERRSGVKVLVASESVEHMLSRAAAEKSAPQADLLALPDLSGLTRAEAAGLFDATALRPAIERVPTAFKSRSGAWTAVTRRWMMPYYAKDQDVAPPADYTDLASERFKGKAALSVSGGSHALLAGMIAEVGLPAAEAWMKAVGANLASPPSGEETEQLRKLAAGKAAVTLADTAVFAKMFHSGYAKDQVTVESVAPAPPKGGAFPDMHGAGVLSGAKRPQEAAALLRFILSSEGARLLADALFEYPVSDDISPLPSVAAAGKSDARGKGADAGSVSAAAALARRAGWASDQ